VAEVSSIIACDILVSILPQHTKYSIAGNTAHQHDFAFEYAVVELFDFAVAAEEDVAVVAGVGVEEFEGGGWHFFILLSIVVSKV
jgi:hypothetical protein